MAGKNGKGGNRFKSHKLRDVMPTGIVSSAVDCCHCGKNIERKDSLCDHRLKDSEGRYCRFCEDCIEVFKKAVNAVDDPTGLVFDAGVEVALGDKDPFFRIRFFSDQGKAPAWQEVSLDDETGGLLVFVRRVGSFVAVKEIGGPKHLTCKVVITKKSTRVAFAEPYIERPKLKVETKVEVELVESKDVEQKSEQDKLDEVHKEIDKIEIESETESEKEEEIEEESEVEKEEE